MNQSLFFRFHNHWINQKVRYRKATYKGRGRPVKSDYVLLKRKDLADYQAAELLQHSFTPTFTDVGIEPIFKNHLSGEERISQPGESWKPKT